MNCRRLTRSTGSAAAGAALTILAACGGHYPLSTFAPKSDFANWIYTVYWEVIGWDSLILIVVSVLLVLALTRFTTRPGTESIPPLYAHEHLILEAAWTVGPAMVLMAIAIPSIIVAFRSQPAAAPPGALLVKVIGHQWWWEFQYPSLAVVTANELHLPLKQAVRLDLESADVIHSFWAPQLGGKRDVVPGHTNHITLTPDTGGDYLGECAEFCGDSHANMRFRVFVDSADVFAKWVESQKKSPSPAGDSAERVAAGARVYSGGPCTSCHRIAGTSSGLRGPDLSHFGSRTTLAGGTLDNSPANVAAWITNPEALKPGAQMPALNLPPKQLADLVAYLESLK